MKKSLHKIVRITQIQRWLEEERATAVVETALLLPTLILLLMGCYDLGQGLSVNQKTIAASQIIGDLITRDRSVTMTSLDGIITAGELALEPYDTLPFGYDIVSVEFDDAGKPEILWRVRENASPNDAAVASTEGLGVPGEGVVIVTAVYKYDPYFSHFMVDEINMREVAFLRGRKSPTVTCSNCPAG